MQELGWDIVYMENDVIEAKFTSGDFNSYVTKITAKIDSIGEVFVVSKSLDDGGWDMGRNSKRVKLFIYAFNEIFKEYDNEKLKSLELEIKKKDNWDDYIVPSKLPLPLDLRKPQFIIPLIGGILASILLAALFAFFAVNIIYLIILYEAIIGIALGYTMKHLIRYGNYINWKSSTMY